MILTSAKDFVGAHNDTVMVGAVPVQLTDCIYHRIRVDGDPIAESEVARWHESAMRELIAARLDEAADSGAVAVAFRAPAGGGGRRPWGIHYSVRETVDDDGIPVSMAQAFVGWS